MNEMSCRERAQKEERSFWNMTTKRDRGDKIGACLVVEGEALHSLYRVQVQPLGWELRSCMLRQVKQIYAAK